MTDSFTNANQRLVKYTDQLLTSRTHSEKKLHTLDTLLNSLYSCVNDEAGFTPFLDDLISQFSVFSSALVCIDPKAKKGYFGWSTGYPAGLISDLIRTGLVFSDEAVMRAATEPVGSIYSWSKGVANFNITNHLSVNSKVWAKATSMKDSACYTFALNDGRKIALILNRNEHQGVFFQEDLKLLNRLAAHIQRAVDLYVSLHKQRQLKQGLDSAINSLDHPMAIYSATGSLVNANPAFIQFGKTHQVFVVEDNSLSFLNEDNDEQFQKMLLMLTLVSEPKAAGMEVMFMKNSEDRLLRLQLRPLYAGDAQLSGVLIEAKDTLTIVEPTVDIIGQVITCSEAEAKVVVRLLAGDDATETAATLRLSPHTVRSHIKEVLNKNNFTRQIDLIAMIIKALG